ncbi:ABC transporter permease subunit [Pseudodesulfovibrio sp. JC047]|uniref:ABC transporter permease n=1 Tax=Pseudodesulfovibrio sp. JC047 TaxID=2683199 RepID=UPI0013D3781E|nr:ABC transporter permease [Pseudodesulfovibrio sp. JC047]NDV18497.1 ABC transporter permease subunit [Pseudodesulfovibrio sp. JC047]
MASTSTAYKGGSVFRSLPSSLFQLWFVGSSALILLFIAAPLTSTIAAPTWERLVETLVDPAVIQSIWLSMSTSGMAAIIALVFGTPLAYILARYEFPGKKLVESIIDLPIMIPHPVVGISLLSLTGRDTWFGTFISDLGIEIMGTSTGIVCVLVFVGLPFYVNTVKGGIESIPPRLENVSRSLGAGRGQTFFRITFPLSWRYMLVGMIMCMARAISEFGAIIIVAYHPMTAPVLMYERFTAYGLGWSQPVAVILILVSMLFFLLLRAFSLPKRTGI